MTEDVRQIDSVAAEAPAQSPRQGGAVARMGLLNARTRALWATLRRDRLPAKIVEDDDAAEARAPRRNPLAAVSAYRASFLLLVILPSLAAIFYLTFLASDQFVAETRFALRPAQSDPGKDRSHALGSGAPAGLPALADQDAYVVASYVQSSAIFKDLADVVDVRAIYRRPEADFWAKLPADARLEDLVSYWRTMVKPAVDSVSGIVTITVRAFRPDDALALAAAISAASERLVNELSARAREDAMRRAEIEVRRAQSQVQSALAAVRSFRDVEGLIDPATEGNSTAQLLLTAMGDRIRMQAEYSSAIQTMSPNAPTLAALKSRLQAADQEIEKLKARLTGANAKTVSSAIARFEELDLQRQFAEKLYGLSQEALERARGKAERQTVYLVAFVPPSLPVEALFPQRLIYSLLTPLALCAIWGILAMLAATIQDHRV